MDAALPDQRRPRRSILALVAWGATLALGLLPYSGRLEHPSLIGDDTIRIENLQTHRLSELLFRPFNEHMAPVFETVSWVAWRLAGRRLAASAVTFTAISYVPLVLAALGFGWLARRDLGTTACACAAMALLLLTPAYFEAIYWYSASSFLWALVFTIAAMGAAAGGRERWRPGMALLSALAAMLAPACSAIGLLAGPAAVILGWPETWASGRRVKAAARALVPLAGTVAYLVVTMLFRYHRLLEHSVRSTGDALGGLKQVVRAPLYLLATSVFRVKQAHQVVPVSWWNAVGFVLLLSALGVAAWRSTGSRRRWSLAGSWFVVGGYVLTLSFRTWLNTDRMDILSLTRYHLFPHVGLAMAAAAAIAPTLERLERRPLRALGASLGLAIALHFWNGPEIGWCAKYVEFREQPAQLAAIDRLAEVGREKGVTRNQAVDAFGTIGARWNFGSRVNVLRILPLLAERPRLADEEVTRTLLAALTPLERGSLFNGMNADAHMSRAGNLEKAVASEPGRVTGTFHLEPVGKSGGYVAEGWQPTLTLEFPRVSGTPRAIRLSGLRSRHDVEIWWTGSDGRWSYRRRVVVSEEIARQGGDWVLRLDDLPHFDGTDGAGIRLVFDPPGPVALEDARLVR